MPPREAGKPWSSQWIDILMRGFAIGAHRGRDLYHHLGSARPQPGRIAAGSDADIERDPSVGKSAATLSNWGSEISRS